MTNFYASYPPAVGSTGIPTYATFAAFPNPVTAGAGAQALALDTDLVYVSNGTSWVVVGGPGVPVSVGAFDSGTPSANGAHIDSNALIMQSASATVPGLVNTTTQTLAGVKTFSSAPNLSSLTASLPLQLDGSKNVTAAAINLSGAQATGTLAAGRFPALTGDVTTTAGSLATSLVATTNSTLTTLSALTSAAALNTVDTITTGTWNATTIAINHGGTGQVTAAAAFGALSPLTTKGDVLGFSTVNARIPVGSDTQVLTADSAQVLGLKWATPATGSVTSVAMTVPAFLNVSGSPVTTSGTLAVTLSGTALPVVNGGTGVTSSTGTGSVVLSTNPVLVTPNLGTPSAVVLSGATGLPLTTGVTGVLPTANGGTGQNSTATFPTSGVIVTEAGTETLTGKSISGSTNTITNVSLTTGVTGNLPIANGGTGQTAALAAYDALAAGATGTPTKGDLLAYDTTTTVRLPVGSNTQVLTADSTQTSGLKWATPTAGTVTSVALTMPAVFSVAGSPVTSSGTLAVTANGTSGGIPYFNATTTMASSGLLTASALVLGGGAGASPTSLANGSSTTVLVGGTPPSFTTIGSPSFFTSGAAASATAFGVSTTYFATIQSSTSTVTNANATSTTADGFQIYLFSTGNTNRTLTLPAASANTGRRISVKKTDSGTGIVTITRAGADTIDGLTTLVLNGQYDSAVITSDGTNWSVVAFLSGFYTEAKSGLISAPGQTTATATYGDVKTLTLTEGEWDVSGIGIVLRNGATFTATDIEVGIGAAATQGDFTSGYNALNFIDWVPVTFSRMSFALPAVRVTSDGTNLTVNGTSTATQVIKLQALIGTTSAGTPQIQALIKARRLR